MTRFARAKGSKASNERKEEDPTPWHIMRQQLSEQLNKIDDNSEKHLPLVDDTIVGLHSREEIWHEFNEFKIKNPSLIKNTKNKTLEELPKSQDEKIRAKETNKIIANNISNIVCLSEIEERKGKTSPSSSTLHQSVYKLEKSKCTKSKTKNPIEERKINCKPNENNIFNHVKSKDKSFLETSKTTIIIENEDMSLNTDVCMKKSNKKINPENSRKEFKTSKFKAQDTKAVKEQTTLTQLEPLSLDTSHKLKRPKHLTPGVLKNDNHEKLSLPVANIKKRINKEFQSFSNRTSRCNVQTIIANGRKIEIVKYEAFWIKKEDASKLKELKKKLKDKQIPNDKIKVVMKLERRKAEKALSREKTNVCYHCRKFGHKFSECPEINNSSISKSGICFKCGSTEHTHFECKVTQSQNFRYAVCFVCNEQGHIARQCSLNPQGQYPKGGSCHLCGEVTHLRKDCPKAFEEKPSSFVTVEKINSVGLEDVSEMKTNNKKQNLVTKKVVHF